MKKIIVLFTFVVLSWLTLPSAFCADASKIGVVDFQKILNESSAGKMIQKEIGDRNNEIKEKLIGEKNLIDKMKADFQREALVLSQEKQDEKAREIRIRNNDAIKMEKRLTDDFKRLQAELLRQFQNDIGLIVSEIGKKEGYLLILEKKRSAVVYSPENIDITEAVIKEYNKKTAKAKN
ncbi:MAG: OmpH family outer membrane protein [Desulfobacterales bacterium]|nr:OmpH family outer membrane protein [Desulfobacterales bacterium]